MNNAITENRRRRLREWFAGKTLPPSEKSYLSQLMTGRSSFGERAARRIERDYGMPQGYLDNGVNVVTTDPGDYSGSKKLSAQQQEFLSILDELPSYEVNKLLDEMREKRVFYKAVLTEFLEKRRKEQKQD